MNIDPAFGTRIKELRQAKNLMQRELAHKAGMDVTYLSKIEKARVVPPPRDVIEKLAKVLDADLGDLLGLAGKTSPQLEQTFKIESARKFLFRHAPNLTEEDWERLLRDVEKREKPS